MGRSLQLPETPLFRVSFLILSPARLLLFLWSHAHWQEKSTLKFPSWRMRVWLGQRHSACLLSVMFHSWHRKTKTSFSLSCQLQLHAPTLHYTPNVQSDGTLWSRCLPWHSSSPYGLSTAGSNGHLWDLVFHPLSPLQCLCLCQPHHTLLLNPAAGSGGGSELAPLYLQLHRDPLTSTQD